MSKVRGLAGGQRLTDTVESRDVLESKSFVSMYQYPQIGRLDVPCGDQIDSLGLDCSST